MPNDMDLIKELRVKVKDKKRGALLDAYLKKQTYDSIAVKALEQLAEDIDAIDKH